MQRKSPPVSPSGALHCFLRPDTITRLSERTKLYRMTISRKLESSMYFVVKHSRKLFYLFKAALFSVVRPLKTPVDCTLSVNYFLLLTS